MEPRSDRLDAVGGGAVGDRDPAASDSAEPAAARLPKKQLGAVIELIGIGLAYFVLAKAGLALASINPSATPIWPPTGLALAAVLLGGYRVWPAIYLGALAANATTAGTIYTSAVIALGNTFECLVGAYLIRRWSDGVNTFDTPAGVARFAAISLAAATPVSATIGVGSLVMAGYAEAEGIPSIWTTWWLGDFTGALVVTPVIVLWASSRDLLARDGLLKSGLVFAAAAIVGIIAFSPLIEQTESRDPLGFLALLPLLWAALRRGQRDTASVALILTCFAVWGTVAGGGPFAQNHLNDSFLLLLMFMISISVPSLALSADVAIRKRAEDQLLRAHEELDRRIQERTAALDQTRQELHQAQKMEALGQLTGGIAHDFNNVLTVIMNSLELVRASASADHRQRLDRAVQAARNGAELVQRMLVFARKQPLQSRPTDINQVVRTTLAMFHQDPIANIDVMTKFTPGLSWARVDSTQIQTAILNVLVNARDAMPSGGTLTIATTDLHRPTRPPADLPAGDYVCVTVSDTGAGMAPEVLSRVFEPFFTTKETGKGTGLGLSMVYSAMRQMGGAVSIESASGKGTTVSLVLPAVEAGPLQEAIVLAPEPVDSSPDSVTLLYVEDDVLVSASTIDILTKAGFTVHAALNAPNALTLLEAHESIALMVTDVGLPGMNGHELASEARRLRPDLKVLFLTGYDRTRAPGGIAEDSATAYLDKPLHQQALLKAVRQLSGVDPGER